MEQVMIARYRDVVKDDDTVYFLGDLTIKGSQHRGYLEHVVGQLPGTKILILGNHDKFDPFVYEEIGFRSVHTALEVEEFILVHDPAKSVTDSSKLWLVGHIHTLFKKQKNCLNVGVDQWEFYPISLEEVRREFNEESSK